MTEHLERIAVVPVVTAIKDSHVTRRRGRVLRNVTLDTRDSTVTKVKLLLTSIRVLFHIDFNRIFKHDIQIILYVKLRKISFDKKLFLDKRQETRNQ